MTDPIDTDAMREQYANGAWEVFLAGDGERSIRIRPTLTQDVAALCDEVDRLRAENAALAAVLEDIAGMLDWNDSGTWRPTAECLQFEDPVCHVRRPEDPAEWCPVCVAEVAWSAWKMGVLG